MAEKRAKRDVIVFYFSNAILSAPKSLSNF